MSPKEMLAKGSTKEMLAKGFINALSQKIVKKFRKKIEMSWADHIFPSVSIGTGEKSYHKIVE